jgi:hypothetical protein
MKEKYMKCFLIVAALLLTVLFNPGTAQAQDNPRAITRATQSSPNLTLTDQELASHGFLPSFKYKGHTFYMQELVNHDDATGRCFTWLKYQLPMKAMKKLVSDAHGISGVRKIMVTEDTAYVYLSSTPSWSSVRPKVMHSIRLALHSAYKVGKMPVFLHPPFPHASISQSK